MNTEIPILPRHSISPPVQARMREDLLARTQDFKPGPRRKILTTGARWALTATGLAAAAVIAVATSPWSAQPAWAATPDRLTGSALVEAQSHCQESLARLPNAPSLTSSPSVMGERRGSTTAVTLSTKSAMGVCVGLATSRYAGIIDLVPRPAREAISVEAFPAVSAADGATRVLVGQVSPRTTRVEVQTDDNRLVDASVRGGHFLAWWPSTAGASKVSAFDGSGIQIGSLNPNALGSGIAPTPQHSPSPPR